MFDYSSGDYARAIEQLQALLTADPSQFDAQCALSMCYYRLGDFPRAIAEGKTAEGMRPKEQLVHTNLSLFYMKSGDKKTAEHHGLQARIAGWRENMAAPGEAVPASEDPDLAMAQTKPPPIKLPSKLADAPWKKKPPIGGTPPSDAQKKDGPL